MTLRAGHDLHKHIEAFDRTRMPRTICHLTRLIATLCLIIAVMFCGFLIWFAQPHFTGCVKPTAMPTTWYGDC